MQWPNLAEQIADYAVTVDVARDATSTREEFRRLDTRIAELEAALKAIIDRWDTPNWKEAEPTAAVIERARSLLEK